MSDKRKSANAVPVAVEFIGNVIINYVILVWEFNSSIIYFK